MDEFITNELIQYKTGFTKGKNDVIELAKLGKKINLFDIEEIEMTLWYRYGYYDAIEYFTKIWQNNEDITSIRVRDVVKTCFANRLILHNKEQKENIPMTTFKL
ncbi:MAG: hypothetical protein HFI08_01185 [Bacilli bacterium]|nr:hypothetical protein [Bacilli bacterium]